jgi:hypothetical protein
LQWTSTDHDDFNLAVGSIQLPVHLIEMQLGHRVADMHGRAYNRTEFIDDRREMIQHWANYLDGLRNQT